MALPPLDPQTRRNLMLGTFGLLLVGYGYWSYLYSPRAAEVTRLEARLDTLDTKNAAARAMTQGVGTDPEGVLAGYRRQLEAVEGLIPSGEELPDLLDAISVEAQRAGVEISLIEPSGASEEGEYTRRVYDMAVLGRYHEIAEFLTRVASLPRIVTPLNLILAPAGTTASGGRPAAPVASGGPQRLEARFSIETYVIPTTSSDNGPSAE